MGAGHFLEILSSLLAAAVPKHEDETRLSCSGEVAHGVWGAEFKEGVSSPRCSRRVKPPVCGDVRGARLPPALLRRGLEKVARTRGEKATTKVGGKPPPAASPPLCERICTGQTCAARGGGGGFPRAGGSVWARCRCAPAERGLPAGPGWRSGPHRAPHTAPHPKPCGPGEMGMEGGDPGWKGLGGGERRSGAVRCSRAKRVGRFRFPFFS